MAIFGAKIRLFGQTDYLQVPDDCVKGDHIVVSTENGLKVARLENGPLDLLPGVADTDFLQVERKATEADLETFAKNTALAQEARQFCIQRIHKRNLEMKLVEVEVFHDRSKFIFYFTAPGRIDFRELVKDLVHEYRARIELRQIGVRHETQRLGAIGNCGRVCCCRNHLRKFAPVTIRMAKEQNLFLNPAKISGICGRLLCCLAYEQDGYENFRHEAPRPGKKYSTSRGPLRVVRISLFRNTVTVSNEQNEEEELSLEEWKRICENRSTRSDRSPETRPRKQASLCKQGDSAPNAVDN